MENLERGFIDVEKILAYVSEEEIFSLVFEELPQEYEYICSPFREDTNPGCWFSRDINGSLRFTDFGNPETYDGIKMNNIDCFDAVRVHYKLPNFYRTLEFVYDRLIRGRKGDIQIRESSTFSKRKKKAPFHFTFEPRDFEARDRRYWEPYGIARQQLIDDKVFPVLRYRLFNTKSGNYTVRPNTICYVFTEFSSGRKKMYLPLSKTRRFITDCTEDDLGGLSSLDEYGETLVITKSYKDWRVLKNTGLLNVVWTQNEGMFPSNNTLIKLCRRFKDIVVFFDNDMTGMEAAIRLTELINVFLPGKARYIFLPEKFFNQGMLDPADARKIVGQETLKNFLYEHIKHP